MQPTILLTPSLRRALDSRPAATPPSRPVARGISAVVSAAVLVTAAACGGEAHGAGAPAEPVVAVRVAAVSPAGSAPIAASGVLGAKDDIPLAFKIGGVVARVAADEGAHVRAGQVLASLDLREIDAAVAKAAAAADKARRDVARVERLYHDSVATLVQWQDAQTGRDVAESDLRSAKMNREYAVIASPVDGVVLSRDVSAGAQVSSGTKVVTIASAARGNVLRAGLADRDAVRVHTGDAATATFDAYPGREFRGRVRQVGAAADARTGTFTIEVTLDGAEHLPSGLVGRVQVHSAPTGVAGSASTGSSAGVVAIPAEALVEGDAGRGVVYTVSANGRVALRREVTLVSMDGDHVLVRGLDDARRVVTAGAAWLRDSARVDIKP